MIAIILLVSAFAVPLLVAAISQLIGLDFRRLDFLPNLFYGLVATSLLTLLSDTTSYPLRENMLFVIDAALLVWMVSTFIVQWLLTGVLIRKIDASDKSAGAPPTTRDGGRWVESMDRGGERRGDDGRDGEISGQVVNCLPSIFSDSMSSGKDTGVKLSSPFAWNFYIYRLQISYLVTNQTVEVTSEAEAVVINWFEKVALGPLSYFVQLLRGAPRVEATARGRVDCLPGQNGQCFIIPNNDPPDLQGDQENEVYAASAINVEPVKIGGIANANLLNYVKLNCIAVAALEGRILVSEANIGGGVSGSTEVGVPGGFPLPGGLTGGPVKGSANLSGNVVIRPSGEKAQVSDGRAVIFKCDGGVVATDSSSSGQ
ncbi:MAG: hypothetical protein AB2551_12350 [Candidatus Thiodiazotropha sp.]